MTRFGYFMTTYLAMLAAGGLAFVHPAPRLIWNATASTPTGLYTLHPVRRLRATELVVVRPPDAIASVLAKGGFLPRGVPLLKHVMALPGDTVCRTDDAITVDGAASGEAQDRDHLGRPLPRWSGCRTLQSGEVFLMNPTVPDSLDGRYFGPLPITSIVAHAVPLWTDEAGDGRFVWRAGSNRARSNSSSTETSMAQIGQFTRTRNGYSGHLHTLSLNAELVLVPAEPSDAENAPDYRIRLGDADGLEVGAGWKRTGEKAGDYVSLLIDDPALVQPIRANLFQSGHSKSAWVLTWNRAPKRSERD